MTIECAEQVDCYVWGQVLAWLFLYTGLSAPSENVQPFPASDDEGTWDLLLSVMPVDHYVTVESTTTFSNTAFNSMLNQESLSLIWIYWGWKV